MQLAISHLASDSIQDIADTGVTLIECVFSKIKNIPDLDRELVRNWVKQLPPTLTPYSVQSITYNCGLTDFIYAAQTLAVVDKILDLAKTMQLKRVVFGSPTIRTGSPDVELFFYIDQALQSTDVMFCIEPNARSYGGKYFFDVEEIVKFISKHNFKNICTMLDTHNAWLEDRDVVSDIRQFQNYIKHVHASEIKLQGFTNIQQHHAIADALASVGYQDVITFESMNMNGINDFINIYRSII